MTSDSLALEDATRPSALAPLSRAPHIAKLPAETLSNIFSLTIPRNTKDRAKSRRVLQLVSKGWRQTACETHALWATIVIDCFHHGDDLDAYVAIMVRRAGIRLSLDLRIQNLSTTAQELVKIGALMEHSIHRVKNVDLSGNGIAPAQLPLENWDVSSIDCFTFTNGKCDMAAIEGSKFRFFSPQKPWNFTSLVIADHGRRIKFESTPFPVNSLRSLHYTDCMMPHGGLLTVTEVVEACVSLQHLTVVGGKATNWRDLRISSTSLVSCTLIAGQSLINAATVTAARNLEYLALVGAAIYGRKRRAYPKLPSLQHLHIDPQGRSIDYRIVEKLIESSGNVKYIRIPEQHYNKLSSTFHDHRPANFIEIELTSPENPKEWNVVQDPDHLTPIVPHVLRAYANQLPTSIQSISSRVILHDDVAALHAYVVADPATGCGWGPVLTGGRATYL